MQERVDNILKFHPELVTPLIFEEFKRSYIQMAKEILDTLIRQAEELESEAGSNG